MYFYMRNIFVFLLSISTAMAQMSASSQEMLSRKGPVQFTHVPFLLLRVNPSQMFGYNNTYQFGAEIAPPVGKLSFAFDYGIGKGKQNINRQVKALQPDNKNKEFRGEIRAYFSDWFPFYALDKKPFGRYYALEYVNGTYERTLGVPLPEGPIELVTGGSLAFADKPTVEKTHVVHLKFGRHIHLHRHLFLDVYGGLGVGKSNISGVGYDIVGDELYNPAELNFLSNKMYENPKTKRYFFSKTFGVRIVVPI